ncbi:hypothetical protein AX17_007490 [Amanita inopinata Kibby_2008]|nr:hypothetical protein AX17_007490 [Amanita inopinata Kibby_2008]
MGINFSALKKITTGFITGVMAMIWAAVLQHYILVPFLIVRQAYQLCLDQSLWLPRRHLSRRQRHRTRLTPQRLDSNWIVSDVSQ